MLDSIDIVFCAFCFINLDSSKLKEFADHNFTFDENGRKFSERVEKTACY